MKRAAALLLACAALAGCRQVGMQPRKLPLPRQEVETTHGVRFEDLFLGQGPSATLGDELLLDYTLFLEDGARIDSTLDRGVPLVVKLGAAPIRGLDEGLIGMQGAGRRRIRVPPALGYGEEGVEGMIPPHATLVFEVHVLEVNVR